MARLLIIEDDLNQCALYTEELTDDGHDVVCASHGTQALEVIRRQPPDLVISDILLPGMSGIEIMEQLLAIAPKMPVIIHSAYSSPQLDFMSSLAYAYVLKSGDLNELKFHIHAVLTKRKEARAD